MPWNIWRSSFTLSFILPTKDINKEISIRNYLPLFWIKKREIPKPLSVSEKEILFINISQYSKWTDFIDQICSCQCIISSSLHGIIIADAYKVPNIWTSFSNNKSKDNEFKFQDYFLSVNKTNERIALYDDLRYQQELIEYIKNKWVGPQIDLNKLLSVCPFKV